MRKQQREPPLSDSWKLPQEVTCYRCGKREYKQRTFRLLLGIQRAIACPECSQVLLGRQAYVGVDENTGEDGYRCSAGDDLAHPDGQEEANQ